MRTMDTEIIKRYIRDDPERLEQHWYHILQDALNRYTQIVCEGDAYRRKREELLRANSLSGCGWDEGHGSGGDTDRLFSILSRTEHDMREYRLSLYSEAEAARREWNAAHRFLILYGKVPVEWRERLWALYHDREPWKVVEERSGLPHSYFTKQRRSIMERICGLYNSTLTDDELAKSPPMEIPAYYVQKRGRND